MAKKKDKRFETVYRQNSFTDCTRVLVDKLTGVNYLFHYENNGGGLTPLLDSRGEPVITPMRYSENYDE